MTGRRELLLSIGLCLLGSGLVLLAVSRAWVSYRIGAAAPLPPRHFSVAGARLVSGARALALVGLAGVAAIPATRGLARVCVGLLIAAGGVGIAVDVMRAVADPDAAMRRAGPFPDVHVATGVSLGPWPYVALLGALLLLVAGLLVVGRGRSWASMSSRYDAPTARPVGERSLWDALDRGEDPTGEPAESGG